MSTNDFPKETPKPRVPIRMGALWPIWLLLLLLIAILIFARSHSRSPVRPETGAPAASVGENTPQPALKAATAHQSLSSFPPEAEPETARLISIMTGKSASQQLRRQAARSLAKIGTDEAMGALKIALTNDTPPYVKAAIAEGLGESPNPESRDLLHELVHGKDETTARAAARGLAARGDADTVDTLGSLLFNDKTPLSVRTEAALALGDVNLPSALDQLTRAVTQIHDQDVLESVLDGMGRRPFSDTQGFFRSYLNSSDVSPDSKVLAIEAFTDAEGDVGPFLSNYLNDPNPDVRAAAKKALNFLDPNPTPAPAH